MTARAELLAVAAGAALLTLGIALAVACLRPTREWLW